MLATLAVVVFVAITIVLPVAMVRGVIQMYRDKDRSGSISSGVAGMMSEIDRVVRPSVQHVVEVKEAAPHKEEDIGGD
jgi:hypothetical protein